MINWPNELAGAHPLAAWGNKLLRACKANEVVSGRGSRITRTAAGTVITPNSSSQRFHPFQIQQTSTWLKYTVGPGYVIIGGDPIVPTYAGDGHEFTITSGVSRFYFCLVLTPTTAIISTSSTLPVWAVDLIPLGWVDTNTYSASSASVVYQFLNENVFSPCVV